LDQAAIENKAEYNYLSALLNSENTSQTSSYSLQHELVEDAATSVVTRRGKGSLETLEIPTTESKLFFSHFKFQSLQTFSNECGLSTLHSFP
jgi:hypothetical protein